MEIKNLLTLVGGRGRNNDRYLGFIKDTHEYTILNGIGKPLNDIRFQNFSVCKYAPLLYVIDNENNWEIIDFDGNNNAKRKFEELIFEVGEDGKADNFGFFKENGKYNFFYVDEYLDSYMIEYPIDEQFDRIKPFKNINESYFSIVYSSEYNGYNILMLSDGGECGLISREWFEYISKPKNGFVMVIRNNNDFEEAPYYNILKLSSGELVYDEWKKDESFNAEIKNESKDLMCRMKLLSE